MTIASKPDLRAIIARDAMHSPIAIADPAAPITEVAELMSSRRIHCVIVEGTRRDASGEHPVWSVVSDLDLIRGVVECDEMPTAAQVAGTEAVCVDAEDNLEIVGGALVAHECSHVVVVDAGRPVGVISTLDIASAVAC